ncbi:CHRD domain-containing protein [Burkholderia sp. Leaf177]|uniref:CHRD domain-containing protein n=1 Tax=Burkholderia sp. Leaf177 TaxID=1736287 RepID=UPI0006FF72BE|nr:CHRD domain-containing protein [Burkholderia sp. Leaf177]KQR84723.1 CHRD domain-containing protein [Burkholderia sp. Leaf177]
MFTRSGSLHRRPLASLALVLLSVASVSAFADSVALQANLQPSSEVPPRVSKGHGVLRATFDTTTKMLQWNVIYGDLSGPATMAHFHGPAPVGQNAKVQVPIDKTALPSPINGEAMLSEEQATDLMAGKYYFNIHTEKNPTGEIRGQVMPAN